MDLKKLDPREAMLFLDISDTRGVAPEWKQVKLTERLGVYLGSVTMERQYVTRDLPSTMLVDYRPCLPQEIALYEGDPVYDFMVKLSYHLFLGEGAVVPALILFGGPHKLAWRADGCVIIPGLLDFARGRITFTIALTSTLRRGTYEVEGEQVTFHEWK